MDAHTFVAYLLPLRDQEVERFIAEHAAEVDDLDAVAQLLKDEAKAQETRDLDKALAYADLLMALANWTKAPGHRALGLLEHANVMLLQGHHREAITFLDTAGEAFLVDNDEIGWARTRVSYLYCASQLGFIEQALEQGEHAREIFVRSGEQWLSVVLEINRAIALEGVGRYQEALTAYDRALLACNFSGDKQAISYKALVLTNKSVVLQMLGDFHSSLHCAQEARAIFAEQGQHLAVANADHNQATFRAGLGQYSEALHLYHQAREYYQQHGLSNWVALTTANMADCLLRLNRTQAALQLAEESVAIYRSLDETPHLGMTLIFLAQAQVACGHIKAALATLEEAHQLFERIEAIATTGTVLLTRANLFLISNQAVEALRTTEQALEIFRTYHMKHWRIEASLLKARIFEALGDLVQAQTLGEEACQEAYQAQLPWLEFGSEYLLGRLAHHQGDLRGADEHYQKALCLLEGLMVWLVRDQRSTFLEDKESLYSALISLSLSRQELNAALDYLERLKSQVLREYLTRSSDIRLKASDPEEARLLEALHHLREELHWYSSQVSLRERSLQAKVLADQQPIRGAIMDQGASELEEDTLLNQYRAEQRKREQAMSELLERAFLQHEHARFMSPARLGERNTSSSGEPLIQVERLATLLSPDTTLLEYFIQGDDLLIFTLQARQTRAEVIHIAGIVGQLGRLLALFRTNIDLVAHHTPMQPAANGLQASLEMNVQGLARRLYDLLLRPIESRIPRNGRLLIVPYGPLHMLPFHALQNEAGYLIEQCEVVYLPAASLLLLQASNDLVTTLPSAKIARTLVLGHSYHGRLPHALKEAQTVAEMLQGECYLEEEATIDRVSAANGDHAIIHLAAHGKNRPDAPDFSYLELANGQLNTLDVFNLNLPAQLVTLSGCETGLVVIGGGDELLGLGRGFLYAGARSLLMSLWRVEDASTAQFMASFYKELLAGQSRAGALRAAQLAILTSGRAGGNTPAWSHPYFWAPFRLLGDAGPIAF